LRSRGIGQSLIAHARDTRKNYRRECSSKGDTQGLFHLGSVASHMGIQVRVVSHACIMNMITHVHPGNRIALLLGQTLELAEISKYCDTCNTYEAISLLI
jgi:hypothetical protein